MKEVIINKFESNEYKVITENDLKEKLNELGITRIKLLGQKFDSTSYDDILNCIKMGYNTEEIVITAVYTNKDNPLVININPYNNTQNTLLISPEWYIENKDIVEEIIQYIVQNINTDNIAIDSPQLINDNLIETVAKNKTLKTLSLTEYEQEDPYYLSKKHYDILKDSNIKKVNTLGVEKEIEENFDPLIGYNQRNLINYYKYNDINSETPLEINIDTQLTIQELDNFKYLHPNKTIVLTEKNYQYINQITEKLKELNLINKILIKIEDKEKFNQFIINNQVKGENIYIKSNDMEVSLKDYLRFEKQLYEMIEEAKKLSPFEKYIYAYNKVKKFKKYKENEEDKMQSRNLYNILENEYMVCVGFSEMFGDLLNKLGIPSKDLGISVDTSYDKSAKEEEQVEGIEKAVEKEGHARRYVYIKDEKYNIDGFYLTDPTWDNDLEKDLYNHLAFTDNEATKTRRYIWLNKYDSSELLNINSIEEFYQKINFLLDRKVKWNDTLERIMKDLINNTLKQLDKNFTVILKKKYPFIENYSWKEDISDLVYEVGIYTLEHVNKEISGKTIMEAVSSVYKEGYGYSEEEITKMIPKIIEDNKKAQERKFPQRYQIDELGNKKNIMNENNKFDIEKDVKTL